MADRLVNRIEREFSISRGRTRTSAFPALLIVGLCVLLVGCGGTSTIGNEAVAPTASTIKTTTTTTIPPTTTTTIDFNRPVNQLDTPLPEEALISEVAEVVNNMRGQTDDLHQQITRLIDFPKMASPVGSQILDFSATMTPGEDGIVAETSVRIRTPNGTSDIGEYFDAELVSRSWNAADVSTEVTETGQKDITVFRWPGTSGDDKELAIGVEPLPGLVLVTIDNHSVIDEDDESYELLQGWQDKIRTPSSARVISASIATSENVGTATVTYELDAESTAEARSDMLDVVRSAEFETTAEPDETDGSPVTLVDVETFEEFLLEFAATGGDEIVEMTVTATFPLTPLD